MVWVQNTVVKTSGNLDVVSVNRASSIRRLWGRTSARVFLTLYLNSMTLYLSPAMFLIYPPFRRTAFYWHCLKVDSASRRWISVEPMFVHRSLEFCRSSSGGGGGRSSFACATMNMQYIKYCTLYVVYSYYHTWGFFFAIWLVRFRAPVVCSTLCACWAAAFLYYTPDWSHHHNPSRERSSRTRHKKIN